MKEVFVIVVQAILLITAVTPVLPLPLLTIPEVEDFLHESTVIQNKYPGALDGPCLCLACDLQVDASRHGIRSALVIISLPDCVANHAVIGFFTTKGMVYYEPSTNMPMQVKPSKTYQSMECLNSKQGCLIWDSTCTGKVTEIDIFWATNNFICTVRRLPSHRCSQQNNSYDNRIDNWRK